MARKQEHLFVNFSENFFECRRCGERYPFHVPVGLYTLEAMAKGFAKEHRHCKVKP